MIIDCISDLHGFLPKLEGGDLLIIAGDVTASDEAKQYIEFYQWLQKKQYKKKIIVPGNHDNYFQQCNEFSPAPFADELATYLCDSGTEFQGLKIWGSPWSKTFQGMNPKCKAFTSDTDKELKEKWALIPEDIDILITHSPPYKFLDQTCRGEQVGSPSLSSRIFDIKPRVHVFGHIHESYGTFSISGLTWNPETLLVNASQVNEHYEPVNKPVRIIL